MDNKWILNAIEANHWDVEDSFVPDGVKFVDDNQLMMIRNTNSNSINANKVVRCRNTNDLVATVNKVYDFYQGQSFSWWVSPLDHPDLMHYLSESGWKVIDEYEGLALSLDDWESKPTSHLIKEVKSDQDIRDLIEVTGDVWGYDEVSRNAAVNEKKFYLRLSDRRGHYFVAYNEKGEPVANGNDRLSHEGQTLYLKGSATLPEYRHRGYYTDLVRFRLNQAKAAGAKWVTVQARVGTSEPILKKMGFKSYGVYKHLVRS